MTENKRFTISGIGISDHEKKRLYDLQTIDGFISVRDELNALHEENQQLKDDLIRHLEEIGSKTEIEEMENKYNFNYPDEHYRVDTMDRKAMGLEPLERWYYD